MKTTTSYAAPSTIATECLAIVVLDHGDKDNPNPLVSPADAALQAAAANLIAAKEVTGKANETILLHAPAGVAAKRILFVGGGKAANFTGFELRRAAGSAARYLKSKGIRSFAFAAPLLDTGLDASFGDSAKSSVEGIYVADFDPNVYQTDRKDQSLEAVTILGPAGCEKAVERGVAEGVILGESQNFTRDLVNEPSNRMTPTILADRAQAMVAETPGLSIEVMGGDEIQAMKMGAFWSVAQGSAEPPRLIVIRYSPQGAAADVKLGLVGKAVTFDTGGISIKPADGMEKMKYDMAGGATMIGAMRAIALLQPAVNVMAVVCATENMPSGTAQKPGDVQIAMSGKSIEIINTDAEGRLVLADGLHYAKEQGCTHLVDAATLTGAVVVALGFVNAGLFSNNDALADSFLAATKRAGEKFWRMPIDEEYRESIKSSIADIVNSGGRWGGSVTAAMFLKEFVGDTPWAHLDIAGTAWMEETKPWIAAKSPTGLALRSLVELVRGMAK